ncbi:M20/M25/M40 family metallo-hydrolase [Streptococcus sp. DD13]|uniref:M20/M25/M40 family metallo-hydrolase n=1 Tax=Streptococcus sp. DD13 TaxID=1777881 RepID=UPI0007963FCF|nr:M20/M25/M40 family metallo-hydrolase [Streptococcus sp. DD13]KXT78134.1 N-acyl-L-amino acid amidohydrolase [Streptococcus sp. DD13]
MPFYSKEEQVNKFDTDPYIQEELSFFKELIARKSIYAQGIGLKDVAYLLKEEFERAGAEVLVDETYTAPFVIAQFKSDQPDAKTLIFYNHYDTQPADGDQVWTYGGPFELTRHEDYLYARGVDDDKGHIVARLTAVKRYLAEHGSLPVHVTFIMEGAEESASVDLEHYLDKYKDRLRGADLLLWEQGRRNPLGQLEISGGNKGIVTFDLVVDSANVDIHSSFGGVIDSASWYLLRAIDSLRKEDGRLAIPSIYEQLREPNQRELDLVAAYGLTKREDLIAVYGLNLATLDEDPEDLLRRLYFEPAINIEGLSTGYQGAGVKTILPASAKAKMEVRLVPGLHPTFVLSEIEKHLKANGFNQVQVIYTLGEESYRSDMSAPSILKLIDLAKDYYADGVAVLPTSPGTGPMHAVYHALEVPMAGVGLGHANSRDHGGDENIAIEDYVTHIELVEELIASYE